MTEIRECHGGEVNFAASGQSDPYMRKYNPCVSAFQDARYGPHKRVHNAQGAKNAGHFRCTVCGSGFGKVRP